MASDYTSSYTGAQIDEGLARARNDEALVQDQVKADTGGSLILSDDSGNGLTILDGGNTSLTAGKYHSADSIRARSASGLILGDDAGQGMLVNDGGIVTNVYQPCFLVKPLNSLFDIPINSDVTVIFDNEIKDQGNNFASNTFTAPISGLYQINAVLYLHTIDSSATDIRLGVVSSNRTYYNIISTNRFSGNLGYYTLMFSGLVDMDENDTVHCKIRQSGGTAQMDIHADYTFFSGYLVA